MELQIIIMHWDRRTLIGRTQTRCSDMEREREN